MKRGIDNKTHQNQIVICLILVVGILSCYWQVQYFSFVNIDDSVYVYENPLSGPD